MIDICDALVILNVKYQTSLVRSTSTFAARRTDAGARRRRRFAVAAPAIKDRLVGQAVVDCLLLLVAWSLLKERNGRVFRRPALNVLDVVRAVLHEGEEWALGGFMPFVALCELWSRQPLTL